MKRIAANGLSFMTAVAGSGPRLLFLTGSAADLRKANTPLRPPLTTHFEVLTYDQRGMGQSDKPDMPYSMQDYATDAVAILDALGWDRVLLAGYSFGGMVAQEIAIHWPQRVRRLALAATTAGGAGGSSYPIEKFSGLEPYERARRGLEVSDLSFTPDWQAANPEAAAARIRKRMSAQAQFADAPGAAVGRRRQLAARAAHDTYDRLGQITAPTLVLAGTRDGQAPMAAQQAMARQIPNGRFETCDGSHQMLWESDETFLRMVAFLQTAEPERRSA